jgi:hypothetical protein
LSIKAIIFGILNNENYAKKKMTDDATVAKDAVKSTKHQQFLFLLFNMIPGYKALHSMNPCELREILTNLNDQLKEKIMQDYDTDIYKSRDYKGMLQTDSSEDD